MIHKNEDEFFNLIRSCLKEKVYAEKLKDKSIPVELSLEEITLIDWALRAYEQEPLYESLEHVVRAIGHGGTSAEIESPFREAHRQVQSYELVMERLRCKLTDAINDKLEADGNQPEFKF